MNLEGCWTSVDNSEMKGMNGIPYFYDLFYDTVSDTGYFPSGRDKIIGFFLERRKRKRKRNAAGDSLGVFVLMKGLSRNWVILTSKRRGKK